MRRSAPRVVLLLLVVLVGLGVADVAQNGAPAVVDRLAAAAATTGTSIRARLEGPLPPNPCSPSPTACRRSSGTKTISGTIRGADGRYVDAMLGFDIIDAHGRKITPDGAPVRSPGYGALERLNYCVPAAGARSATPGCRGSALAERWSLALPANAVAVYVEAYPKAATPGNWLAQATYQGPDPGRTDQSVYGMSYRRQIPVGGSGASGVDLLLPKVCDSSGGSTGELWGRLYRNGQPWFASGGTANAWATDAGIAGVLGMGIGHVDPGAGTYRIANLQAGSRYTIIADVDGHQQQWLGRQPTVRACTSTRFDLDFSR